MTTQMIIAQCLMVLTLIIMITGKTPLYLIAIVGAAVSPSSPDTRSRDPLL